MLLKCLGVPPSYEWEVHGVSLDQIYPALQSKSRFQGSRVPFRFLRPTKKRAHHSQTQRLKANGHCCWEFVFNGSKKWMVVHIYYNGFQNQYL
jgi:hypothetical protein